MIDDETIMEMKDFTKESCIPVPQMDYDKLLWIEVAKVSLQNNCTTYQSISRANEMLIDFINTFSR